MDIFQKYVNKNAHNLDIGCGYGRILNELYDSGYNNTVGIDFSEKMIERGKIMYPNLCLKTMIKVKTNYLENIFDAVILLAVLTCVIDNGEQMDLLNEIKKIKT